MGDSEGSKDSQGSGGCPVDFSQRNSSGWSFMAGLGAAKQENPEGSGCRFASGDATSPASIEEAASHAQTPQPDQRFPLRTERQVSSIPRGATEGSNVPRHQDGQEESNNWVYPSEQQLYNAMRRKGWSNVPEDSIPVVLKIHNTINEGTWEKIVGWEGSNQIKLSRFQGRPRDLSPKAFLYSYILQLYPKPFDRHDWYVENKEANGASRSFYNWPWQATSDSAPLQRYVIDYYMIEQKDPRLPPRTYVDARPALDGPRGVTLRAQRVLADAFPGITAFLKRMQAENRIPPADHLGKDSKRG